MARTKEAGGILETILLLALPASGKSEVRRYLKHLPPRTCREDFHMGPTVQIDDFLYVHMMRRIDDELAALGKDRVYFQSPEKPFRDNWDWGTLMQLLNEDYEDLREKRILKPASAAAHLIERLERASSLCGLRPRLGKLDAGTRRSLERALDKEAGALLKEKQENTPDTLRGKTLVVEFARGGPQGAPMPLPEPLGYRYALGQLCEPLLKKASILYVWVTPEESRRKNQARTDPDDPGSILHHGVPLDVMLNDYGCDDMDWLEADAGRKGSIGVKAHGKTFQLPLARFDNRTDKTSFLRADPQTWRPQDVKAVHEGLKGALDALARKETSCPN